MCPGKKRSIVRETKTLPDVGTEEKGDISHIKGELEFKTDIHVQNIVTSEHYCLGILH